MVHIIYKTTNLINGKFYIGKHSTSDINDGYIGSGQVLRKAIKKHGRENFRTEVLHSFDNIDDCYEKERELVTLELIRNKKCYNAALGGRGALPAEKNGMYQRRHTPEAIEKIRQASLNQKPFSQFSRDKISKKHKGKITSEETKRKISEAKMGRKDSLETRQKKSRSRMGKSPSPESIEKSRLKRIGTKRSAETKRKISIMASQKVGDKNSNFRPLSGEAQEFIRKHYQTKSINWIKTHLAEQSVSRCRVVRQINQLLK